MFNFDKDKLENYIKKLNEPSVLIIGDMGIDEMVYGDTERISREAPVLILRHANTKIILGQAANAAHNLATINGAKVSALGLYGDDYYGPQLLEAFQEAGINTEYMVKDNTRTTTVKSRISGASFHSVAQQIVRIDRVDSKMLSKEIEDKIIENIEKAIPLHDAVILSDYNIGMLTDRVIAATIETAKKYNIPCVVSMNPIMIDGTGMCGCCRLMVDGEMKFACVDGPDFDGYKVNFDEMIERNGMYCDFERQAYEETCNLFKKEVK